MEIILMRHYKVGLKFKKNYNSEDFDCDAMLYNQTPVLDQKGPELPLYRLYASSMPRAQQTAELAFRRQFEILEGVQEVTMRSYCDTGRHHPKWWWELMGRIQWRFNHKRPHETYRETMDRLEKALMVLIERDEDAIVVMHGLAMRYMVKILRKYGFSGPTILHAKNGECFTYKSKGVLN